MLGNGDKRREPQDSFAELELPTSPGTPQGGVLYDRDMHTLVGKLMSAVVILDKRQQAMRRELRSITRKQTAIIGTILAAVQAAVEVWRQVHH